MMQNKINQIFFAERLALLLNSGISMVSALSMMKNLEKSIEVKVIYEKIIISIEQGVPLSRSIRNAKIKFNNSLLVFIENGESSGRLSQALHQAYIQLEKNNEIKHKLINTLVYPSFIILATISMTLFLILYIFPKIIPLLTSLDIQLPLVTRIVQNIYYFSVYYGTWSILSLFLFCATLFFLLKRNKKIKYKLHSLVISTPFVSSYIKTYTMSSICSMGDTLLSTEKGLPDFILFIRDSSRNMVYKNAFGVIYTDVNKGISFSNSLRKYINLFPPLLPDMCALGEKTGSLPIMLGHCAKIFERDTDNTLKRFSSLIEPILMILMGLIVGSIALSIILPVYEITNHLTQ